MKSSSALLLCSLCAVSLWGTDAGQEIAWMGKKETLVKNDENCGQSPRHMRVSARYTSPKGVGYNEGYSTLETFLSPRNVFNDKWLPFIDGRGHIFDNGKWAANAGLGVRYLSSSRVWGINSYYDYRSTSRKKYNQVSVGLETLGTLFDFRINGYLPVGKTHSSLFHTRFKSFKEHFMYVSSKREFALKGINAEAGFHVDHFRKVPLYFAAGPYYLTGKGASTWGGQFRARVDLLKHYVRLEGNTAYDHFFKWTGQGQISINIPFGGKAPVKKRGNCCCRSMTLSERIVQPVDRSEIIPVGRQRIRSAAINPATGQPFFFIFVDNTSHSLGTYESPYPTLLEAQNASNPNDIIYIFPGDQTSNGMASGFTFKDNQRLWGSAIAHSLITTLGKVQIPAQSIGSFVNNTYGTSVALLPIITGAGTVVTVANNNEISGLYIQNVSGSAIAGTSVTNLTITHNTFQGFAGEEILFTDLGGTLLIDSNTISAGPMDSAINLTNTTANLNATITNNQIIAGANTFIWSLATQGALQFNGNTARAGMNVVNVAQGSSSSLAATVANNNMQMFNNAVILTAGGVNTLITVQSNAIDGGGSASAIEIDQTTGILGATVSNNNIVNYGPGFLLNAGGSNATVSLQSNIINPGSSNPSSAPAIQMNQTAGSLNASILSNQTASGYQGFLLNAGGSTATVSLQSNTFISYFEHGIDLEQTAGSLTATVTGNNLSAQDNNGFNFTNNTAANSIANLTITDNTIAGYQGIAFNQNVGTVTSLIDSNILSTNFTGPPVSLVLNVTSGSQNVTLSNNTITQSNGDGFDFFFYNQGSAVWNVNNNTLYGVAGNATRISTNSTPGVNASVCLKFNNNTAYPVKFNGQGTYNFDNTGNTGTFTLNPPVGNVGMFNNYTATGVVTGTCP